MEGLNVSLTQSSSLLRQRLRGCLAQILLSKPSNDARSFDGHEPPAVLCAVLPLSVLFSRAALAPIASFLAIHCC